MKHSERGQNWEQIIQRDYCEIPSNVLRIHGSYKCDRPFTIFHSGGSIDVSRGDKIVFGEDGDITIHDTGATTAELDKEERRRKKEGTEVGFWESVMAAGFVGITASEHRIVLDTISRISD